MGEPGDIEKRVKEEIDGETQREREGGVKEGEAERERE